MSPISWGVARTLPFPGTLGNPPHGHPLTVPSPAAMEPVAVVASCGFEWPRQRDIPMGWDTHGDQMGSVPGPDTHWRCEWQRGFAGRCPTAQVGAGAG